MRYNDGGFGSPTNGYLAFRLRVGADLNPSGYLCAAIVGMDANLDGRLDLFIGVNNQGSGNHIGLWNPGNGLNISPSTTSIVSPATVSYAETGSTYGFTDVNSTIDPPALSFDLNGDGRTDQFLSFVVPFSDVVAAMAARGIAGFTKDTPMRLVAATATQDNSLNQDLIGVAGGVNSTITWEQLGALTEIYSASSQGRCLNRQPWHSSAWPQSVCYIARVAVELGLRDRAFVVLKTNRHSRLCRHLLELLTRQ